MTPDSLEPLVPIGTLIGAALIARAWMARTADLKLTLFRPYRGESWPIGVQEEDEVHFRWSSSSRDAHPGDGRHAPAGDMNSTPEPGLDAPLLEEIIGGGAQVAPVRRTHARHG